MRKLHLVARLGLLFVILQVAPAVAQIINDDGVIPRGTSAEAVRQQLGEPAKIVTSVGPGPLVERWIYSDNRVVAVQEGFVIDSFVVESQQ